LRALGSLNSDRLARDTFVRRRSPLAILSAMEGRDAVNRSTSNLLLFKSSIDNAFLDFGISDSEENQFFVDRDSDLITGSTAEPPTNLEQSRR
jgi:hypothetical protein